MRRRPVESAPAYLVMSWPIDAVAGRFAPSACEIRRDGIVIVESTPVIPTSPVLLFAMIAARAPAFWAFLTLIMNVHEPRSIRAIFPARAEAFVIAEHASVVTGPAVSAGSCAATICVENWTLA